MNDSLVDSVTSQWARLGAMFNVRAAPRTPDLERLLLDTARAAPANSRLFILAATWLARFGDYVAKHRLARLIRDELEPEHRPVLGFMLEWAKRHGASTGSRFNLAIKACGPLPAGDALSGALSDGRPLLDVERHNPHLARLAERRASELSRKWGRWMADFEPKLDALRPDEWVAANNPALYERALTGGDLIASVLAECEAHAGPVASESELARRCGASRPAVRDAIRRLRLAGRLRTVERGRSNAIELRPPHAA
jgi:hypothetical protein